MAEQIEPRGTFADHPGLAALARMVHEQRRKVAGTLRIVAEDKKLREEMDGLLEAVGVDVVTCNGYEVRRSSKDGKRFCVVTKLPE